VNNFVFHLCLLRLARLICTLVWCNFGNMEQNLYFCIVRMMFIYHLSPHTFRDVKTLKKISFKRLIDVSASWEMHFNLYYCIFFISFFSRLDKYDSDFELPEFHLAPYKNQILFERDSIEYFCYSTWMEPSGIIWQKNGEILTEGPNVVITTKSDLVNGSYSSHLVIKR